MRECNFTMLGEKDHGKSTLIGNLLIHTGHATRERIKEASKVGTRFEPAHILDSFSYERENEMTLDTTRAQLVYRDMIMGFIDVPGHLELISNALSGASNAEIAIVVVSSRDGEGFTDQTRRHLFLADLLGMRAFVFAINKLDSCGYDGAVFERLRSEIERYLRAAHMDQPAAFVPIAAYDNENLTTPTRKMPWYDGQPLLETVYSLADKHSTVQDAARMELRVLVQDSEAERGALFGMVCYGEIGKGDRVRVFPSGLDVTVREIYVGDKRSNRAAARRNVTLLLDRAQAVPRGSLISTRDAAINATGTFAARLFLTSPLDAAGGGLSIRMNNMAFPVKKLEITRLVSPLTGKGRKPTGSAIKPNSGARATITLSESHPVDSFKRFEDLGRFSLYHNGRFCGFGIIE